MKTKISYKAKKRILTSVIIAILMIIVGVGAYFYMQGNSDSQAIDQNNLEYTETKNNESINNSKEENAIKNDANEREEETIEQNMEETNEEQEQEQQAETVENDNNGLETEEVTEETENVTNNNNNDNNNTETDEDQDIEYTTVERVEEEEVLVSESFDLIWEPLDINCKPTIANLNIIYEKEPGITIEKRRVGTGIVEVNDTIIYEIEVKNTGNTYLTDVKVYDTMNENQEGKTRKVTITEVSVANEIRNWKEENGAYYIGELKVGETALIKATYKVKEDDVAETEQTIINTAKAIALSEGETQIETDESKVEAKTKSYKADIVLKKESKLIKANQNSELGKNVAEFGDTIVYTITATNRGNKVGKVVVKDCIPDGVELVEYNANSTNLSNEEYEKLTKATIKDKFSKELEVEANNGTASIFFTVTVTGLPGSTVQNIATDARDESDVPEPGNKIEKIVEVKKLEETFQNTNLVVVLDRSRTMEWNSLSYNGTTQTRMAVAKQVINTYIIDKMNFKDDGTGSAVSVVEFWGPNSNKGIDTRDDHYRWNNVVGKANTNAQAAALKTGVNNIKVNVKSEDEQTGTVISSSLIRAKEQMVELYNMNPNNNNVVIFVSDGKPEGDDDQDNIKTYADNLKSAVPGGVHVFTIGFGANPDDDVSWKTYLQNTIASSTNNFFHAASSNMNQVFNDLSKVVSSSYIGSSVSNNGVITLTDVKISEPITIRVTNKDNITDTIIENATSETHEIDLSRFDADAKIEIEYHKKS